MTTFYIPSQALQSNEKAFMLLEVPKWHRPSDSWHRIQYIFVDRNDHMARFEEDLGEWSGIPLRVLGLWEETVGSLQGIAERERLGPSSEYWQNFLAEQQDSSDLIERALQQAEQNREVMHNRSVIGPAHRKERNGAPQWLTS